MNEKYWKVVFIDLLAKLCNNNFVIGLLTKNIEVRIDWFYHWRLMAQKSNFYG